MLVTACVLGPGDRVKAHAGRCARQVTRQLSAWAKAPCAWATAPLWTHRALGASGGKSPLDGQFATIGARHRDCI